MFVDTVYVFALQCMEPPTKYGRVFSLTSVANKLN